jgi:hypothetical protein
VKLCFVAPNGSYARQLKVKPCAQCIMCFKAYSQSRYHFLSTRLKDFVFAIFQIQNLNETNLSERFWISQIIIVFMVVVISHMHM